MGFLDALFNPNRNTDQGYSQATTRFDQNAAVTNPFLRDLVGSGQQANSYLADLMGFGPGSESVLQGLMDNPAYQAQLKSGLEGVDASAAARGMSQSGDTLKALNDYSQQSYGNFRQNEINNARGQLGFGLSGVTGLGNDASRYGQLAIGRGQARDAGNAGAFGNIMGIGSTLLGLGTGMPMGGTFGNTNMPKQQVNAPVGIGRIY